MSTNPVIPTGARIVVVDDSRTVLASARSALSSAGHDVVTASDPSQLDEEQLRSADLIFVDVNMEEVFGDDVVSFFVNVWNVSAPIFLYSTIEQQELERRASAVGASGAICKSRGPEALVEVVATVQRSGLSGLRA